jgi:hypothetical protein
MFLVALIVIGLGTALVLALGKILAGEHGWVAPIVFGLGTPLVLALGQILVGRALVRRFGSIDASRASVLDHARMIRRRASRRRG